MLFSIYNSRFRFLVCGMVLCIVMLLCLVLSMELGYLRKSELVSWVHNHKNKVTKPIIESITKTEEDQKPPPKPLPTEIFPVMNTGSLPQINPLHITNKEWSAYSEVNGKKVAKYHTPLFIGFTRNWFLLQQAVASYVAVGWPSEMIYVVDNTGVMDSNELGLLTKKNPWYLNTTRLTAPHENGGLGANVIRTPTLLTFAQLQNFFISTAIQRKWDHFFWSHMDVVVLSDEDGQIRRETREKALKEKAEKAKEQGKKSGFGTPEEEEEEADKPLPHYKGFYEKVIECMEDTKKNKMWAIRFFAYDWLTLVNVQPMKDIGAWDTQIPFYLTDCDFYERLYMKNYTSADCRAGHIFDLASTLDDLSILYPSPHDNSTDPNTQRFKDLKQKLEDLASQKHNNKNGRNTWQAAQNGGHGEPFWRNPKGFEFAIKRTIEFGRSVYEDKWGTRSCNLRKLGRNDPDLDAWKYVTEGKKLRVWPDDTHGA